jgi:hypothetical protein
VRTNYALIRENSMLSDNSRDAISIDLEDLDGTLENMFDCLETASKSVQLSYLEFHNLKTDMYFEGEYETTYEEVYKSLLSLKWHLGIFEEHIDATCFPLLLKSSGKKDTHYMN